MASDIASGVGELGEHQHLAVGEAFAAKQSSELFSLSSRAGVNRLVSSRNWEIWSRSRNTSLRISGTSYSSRDNLALAVLLEGVDALIRADVVGQRLIDGQREQGVFLVKGSLE